MVRITVNTSIVQITNKRVYEKIFTCPACKKEYEVFYGLRQKCVECGANFIDVFNILEEQWKRALWHISKDEFKKDYYSQDSKNWGEKFNDTNAV